MKLSLCLMFKHLADDKWLGQKKLPAMIVWKKISKSHHLALDHWKTDSLSLLTLTWPIRQEAVGLKEKISTKTRWRSSFWNWTMKEEKRNSSYVLLLWFGGRQKMTNNPKKNQHLFTPLHHQLSNNLFGLQTIGENQISVVSLSFWTKTWTVIIHPRPKTATPVFSPSRKIKSKYKKKICLRLWSISVNFCFCLSYSLVFQNNPQPPFFVSLSTYNFSLSFLSLAFTP